MRYKKPQERMTLDIGLVEDLIAPDHYIRLLAEFVERAVASNETYYTQKGKGTTGQKPYGAVTLLLLYIYGYLNRISSSRRLELEAHRNIEVIWLLGGLRPDFKTIADYRKDNGEQFRSLLKAFNTFLKTHGYIEGKGVSVDGLRTKAHTSRGAMSVEKIKNRLEKLDGKLNRYLSQVEENDKKEALQIDLGRLDMKKKQALEKIAQLQEEIEDLLKKKEIIEQDSRKRINFTDAEGCLTQSRDGCMPCYNNQSVVCDKHKLMMVWQVTTTSNDRNNLKPMMEQVEQQYDQRPEVCRSDADYFNIKDIQALEQRGIDCYCNIPKAAQTKKGKDKNGQPIEFSYDPRQDQYRCSKGGVLVRRGYEPNKGGRGATRYQGTRCQDCPIRKNCTKAKQRSIYRYDDEEWKERYIKKMNSPTGQRHKALRRAYAEHPFGTIKTTMMDRLQLKLRGRYKVQTEICIYHFAYNFKRLTNIECFDYLMNQIRNYGF